MKLNEKKNTFKVTRLCKDREGDPFVFAFSFRVNINKSFL